VELAVAGDADAFEALYRNWHSRLQRYALFLLGNAEDARDVTQLTAIAIARNIHRLNEPASFAPWAYTILRRRAADYISREQKQRALAESMSREGHQEVPHVADTEGFQWLDLIGSLGAVDREILTAYYVDKDIAGCFAIPRGTVKSRLHSARARLKAAYKQIEGVKQ